MTMSYIHTPTGRYPLSPKHIRAENPNVSFPEIFQPPPEYVSVLPVDRPAHDPITQGVREGAPVKMGDHWNQSWEVYALSNEVIRANREAKANEVRGERNAKLDGSDWTQVIDAKVDQAAWAVYRQALRDITQQSGFPYDVVWPVEPAK